MNHCLAIRPAVPLLRAFSVLLALGFFSLTSAQAQRTATAKTTVGLGYVTSIKVTDGGSGYASAPTVTLSGGGGTNAAAVAMVTNGIVSLITVTAAGSGYTNPPTVVLSPPPHATTLGLKKVLLNTQGTAQAVATVMSGYLDTITVVEGGSGYTKTPTVTITGGGGTGAAAVAVVSHGTVSAILKTLAGSGYTSAPAVVISPPPQPTGSGAGMVPLLSVQGDRGANVVVQWADGLRGSNTWLTITNVLMGSNAWQWADISATQAVQRFYRAMESAVAPSNMLLVPTGPFAMGNGMSPSEGNPDELPLHTVYVSAFYADRFAVTKALWDAVYLWATNAGYAFDNPGSYYSGAFHSKGLNHPVHSISWFDCLKWCNARSEKEGRIPAYYTSSNRTSVYRTGQVTPQNQWVNWLAGYRLPTEAERERMTRGGTAGRRFPWSSADTITQSRANYFSLWVNGHPYFAYDVNSTLGSPRAYDDGVDPYTSPVGSFAANDYGLFDLAGNLWEWCWDWYGDTYYSTSPETDPQGPASGTLRVLRGGSWYDTPFYCRAAARNSSAPTAWGNHVGFRCVLPVTQP
jgi:formylglycine-generating enzyme